MTDEQKAQAVLEMLAGTVLCVDCGVMLPEFPFANYPPDRPTRCLFCVYKRHPLASITK